MRLQRELTSAAHVATKHVRKMTSVSVLFGRPEQPPSAGQCELEQTVLYVSPRSANHFVSLLCAVIKCSAKRVTMRLPSKQHVQLPVWGISQGISSISLPSAVVFPPVPMPSLHRDHTAAQTSVTHRHHWRHSDLKAEVCLPSLNKPYRSANSKTLSLSASHCSQVPEWIIQEKMEM